MSTTATHINVWFDCASGMLSNSKPHLEKKHLIALSAPSAVAWRFIKGQLDAAAASGDNIVIQIQWALPSY